MAMNKSDAKGSYTAGDVVLTTYGVGVVVQKRADGSFAIRLWRIPGKSVGSAAQAFLQPTTVSEAAGGTLEWTTLLVVLLMVSRTQLFHSFLDPSSASRGTWDDNTPLHSRECLITHFQRWFFDLFWKPIFGALLLQGSERVPREPTYRLC